ncbi:hypothetical protein GJ496_006683 [Pomphorhynchus laevis]|nr:hypothetical protein GJ496_006683 [Pomphorhynchus laevis]
MGITGLISFVDSACRQAHISEFSGQVIAVDAYNWIYRGATTCAVRLAEIGILSDTCAESKNVISNAISPIVTYVLRRVDTLKQFKIIPILVFDGRDLPLKSKIDQKRRSLKQSNMEKIKSVINNNNNLSEQDWASIEVRDACRKAFEVKYIIVRHVIVALRSISCPYIVAPFEADAQLAYFCKLKIANAVLTEDSDLIPYGCNTILFKFDQATCTCQRYDFSLLCNNDNTTAGNLFAYGQNRKFTIDRIRWMCILSGCDYFEGIPGIGLKKAYAILKKTRKTELTDILRHVRTCLTHTKIPKDLNQRFIDADYMFKHQFIFDLISNQLCPLNSIDTENKSPSEIKGNIQDPIAPFSNDEALLQALGCFNYEIMQIHDDDKNIDVKALSHRLWGQVLKSKHSSKQMQQQSLNSFPVSLSLSSNEPHSYGSNSLKKRSTLIVDEMTADVVRITRPKTIALPSCSEETTSANIVEAIFSQYATSSVNQMNGRSYHHNLVTTDHYDVQLDKVLIEHGKYSDNKTLSSKIYLPGSMTSLHSPYFHNSKLDGSLSSNSELLIESSSHLNINSLINTRSNDKDTSATDVDEPIMLLAKKQNASIFDSIDNDTGIDVNSKKTVKTTPVVRTHHCFYSGSHTIPLKLPRTSMPTSAQKCQEDNRFCQHSRSQRVSSSSSSTSLCYNSQYINNCSGNGRSLGPSRKIGLSRISSLPAKKSKQCNGKSIRQFFKSISSSITAKEDEENCTSNYNKQKYSSDKSQSKIVNVLIN